MNHAHTPRRHLAAAVTAVLTLTVGTLAAPTVATAAPDTSPVAGVAAATDVAVPYGPGDSLWGLGRTGFLSWDASDPNIARWTRFADGKATAFPYGHTLFGSLDSDIVVDESQGVSTLRDMAADGKELLAVDPAGAGLAGQYAGAVRSTLFVSTVDGGGRALHLYEPGAGTPTKRTVTGLPADVTRVFAQAVAGDTVLLSYETPDRHHWALLDLKTAAVTSKRTIAGRSSRPAVSATHVAWTEYNANGVATVHVLERAAGGRLQRFPMAEAGNVAVGLVGTWVTYSRPGGLLDHPASPLHALTARNLTDGTTRKLLDHTVSAIDAPGDAIGFVGGTVAGGEGLYRISPGTGGVPVATLLAATGGQTKVALLGHNVPAVVDLDRNGGRLAMAWRLNRNNVSMSVTIRNTRTGESRTDSVLPSTLGEDEPPMRFTWQGELGWNGSADPWTGASAGPYTWQITAKPLNGIGPELKTSGSFTVTRKPGLHDYDADGSPDVFLRDSTGRLWMAETFPSLYWDQLDQHPGLLVGPGWNTYDRIEAAGNLAGSAVSDVVARDRAGVLWLYQGTGNAKAPLATRVRIGDGWSTYTQLTGGSDLTGDGRSDLVATDRAGVLWLYKGTGSRTAPFAARKRIGGGWGGYNQLTATGNLAGGAAGDLVARDRAGVLWLYLGKGDGTFAARTRIGAGWSSYQHLLGIGDANRDGRPDLYTSATPDGHSLSLYKGTGAWRQPFGPARGVNALSWLDDPHFTLFV
ncbi:VCBS repeat-containing protein [Streptomyces sp. SJL17-4]|uniref:FG-GAP repeat domain-containing protein n=1 Tax=Streptomyces sp. SJL17-4 TaxID=2967224 RepID=UPI0030CB1026